MLHIHHVNVFVATNVLMVMTVSAIEEFKFHSVLVCAGSYGTVLEEHGSVRSSMDCATLCSNSPECTSGLYNIGTKSCKLNMEPWLTYQTHGCSLEEKYFERLPYCVAQDSCTIPKQGMRLCDGGGHGVCDASKGRIEVLHQDTWHTVCDDFWGDTGSHEVHGNFADTNSKVTCRMLGYTNGTAHIYSYFGPGSGSILLDNVSCHGNETSLYECPANAWGTSNCVHMEDVGVSCS